MVALQGERDGRFSFDKVLKHSILNTESFLTILQVVTVGSSLGSRFVCSNTQERQQLLWWQKFSIVVGGHCLFTFLFVFNLICWMTQERQAWILYCVEHYLSKVLLLWVCLIVTIFVINKYCHLTLLSQYLLSAYIFTRLWWITWWQHLFSC